MSISIESCPLNLILFQGPTGATGFQGDTSSVTGGVGITGFQGTRGVQGITGAQGFAGGSMAGSQGDPGSPGGLGAFGFMGFQGESPQGETGLQGLQGAPGLFIPGVTGPPGPVGSQGFQGAMGASEVVGPQGDIGAPGPIGISGAPAPIGSGQIVRNKNGDELIGIFETQSLPQFSIIESKLSGKHSCRVGNIDAWNLSSNLFNISTDDSQISGQPATFVIQSTGTYIITYNITLDVLTDLAIIIDFVCQSGISEPRTTMPGSLSSISVSNNERTHLSHTFIGYLNFGDRIGVYASNETMSNVCFNMYQSNFIIKVLD